VSRAGTPAGLTLSRAETRLRANELAKVVAAAGRANVPSRDIEAPNRRRHLNAGQTAILLARAYPERDSVGGRSQKGGIETYADSAQVSLRLLTYAYLIEDYAPELGDQVLAKLISFEEARLKARDRKAEAETNAEKMARLKAEAPDLVPARDEVAGYRAYLKQIGLQKDRANECECIRWPQPHSTNCRI
jgi:hypothetical protein